MYIYIYVSFNCLQLQSPGGGSSSSARRPDVALSSLSSLSLAPLALGAWRSSRGAETAWLNSEHGMDGATGGPLQRSVEI